MSSKVSTPPPVLVLGLVAISGAASLTYELLWIRALGRHFGTTTLAITTVVATFMAGLGIGYVWFGRRADQSRYPFRLYQRLELSIAAAGLAVSLFLLRADAALDALARLCAAAGPFGAACMLLVFALLMLLPTIAMGGTVPVLASALGRGGRPAHALSLLYASNTLGAIAGALGPDFVIIPRWGMTTAGWLAALGNLGVALIMRRYSGDEVAVESSDATAPELETGVERVSAQRLAALVLSACSGFCALGLEVLWSRTLQHWASALVTSFAVLLAMYLAALALGAFLTERMAVRARQPLAAACVLTGLTGLCALLPLRAAPAWRDVERAWWPRPEDIRRLGLAREAIDALLHAGFLELTPCLLMGATFPFVAAAWLADGKAGARSGQLFVVNTFAGVLGSLVVGFWWLPDLGEQWSYAALALALASAAALCALVSARVIAAVSGACLAGVIGLTLALPASQLFQAHFRSGGHVLAVKEGATTTAAAAARFLYGEPYNMELLTPGVSMSSTHSMARRYMSVMAHAAMLTAPQPERALLICYGVGNTARALLAHPSLKELDIADTSSEVLSLSSHFAAALDGDDPLRDPRTHVFVDDGRHHLITSDARYDVITAEPPPPNHAAVANLYSREFYRIARRRLAAGGVITQWLPVFQLSDDDARSMIAAFVAELPHTALLYGAEEHLVLIGSAEPLHMRPVLDETLMRALRKSYIGSAEDLLGSVVQTDAELRASVSKTRPLSDDLPSIQYPREDVRGGTFFTNTFKTNPARALSLITADADRGRTHRAATATQAVLTSLPLRELAPTELRELTLGRLLARSLGENPDDQGLWALLAVDIDRAHLAERALSRPGASQLIAKAVAEIPAAERARYFVLQDALWMLARRAFYARDYARALDLFQQLHPEASDTAKHWLFVAGCLRALNRAEESARAFGSAAATSSNPAFREACTALAGRAALAGTWDLPL